MRNWAGNYEYQAAAVHEPDSVDAVVRYVRDAAKLRVIGNRHSFHDLPDSPGGTVLSLRKMDRLLSIDAGSHGPTVTIEGGTAYGPLGPALHAKGYALHNLASLPHITVAGAVATATHGSGVCNGGLATSVVEMELVTADGEVRTLRRGDADFDGAVVGLGGLGVVTKLTLALVPAFDVEQTVYRRVPMAKLAELYETILSDTYSVSVFTTWQTDAFEQVWLKGWAGQPVVDLHAIGGTLATQAVHPIEDVPGMPPFVGNDPEKCTIQLGKPGPWHARLPHFKLEHTPSSGEELQSEFFVPRQHARAAWEAVASLRDDIRPMIQVSELRTVAADTLWMSPYYDRPSAGIHFTWRRDPAGVAAVVAKIEAKLAPFDARPHWAKVFTTSGDRLAGLYPKLSAFRDLLRRYDPAGKFRNPFLARCGL